MRTLTTHLGITMEWSVERGCFHNAANPFTIVGYVNGVCRMSHAVSAKTASSRERIEQRVISRIDQIFKEQAAA